MVYVTNACVSPMKGGVEAGYTGTAINFQQTGGGKWLFSRGARTPDQAFGEYTIHHKSGISDKDTHQRFFGHCMAANGKIVLLREALNVLAAADAMFPNGIADIVNKK